MSDHPPPIHLKTPDGEFSICFNRLAKWALGVAATLTAALLIGAFTFALRSNEVLGRIDERLIALDSKVEAATKRNEHRIERLEDRVRQ